MWLKQEFGRRCYFPDHNGEFNFDHEVGDRVLSLIVEGTPVIQANHTVPCATVATTSNTAGHNQPYYKPIASKKDTTFNVKVVKAKMSKLHNGKVEFEKLEQTHVSLDDRTANVNTVTCAIQSKWGSEYIVVTGDGLEVDDSSGTQGTRYRTLLNEIEIGCSIILYMFLKLSIVMSINHSCYFQENFGEFLQESFMLFSALNLNVKEKEKRESNLTLLLIVVLTQMIFCQVLTCPKRYVAACLLMEHHAPR